MRFRSFPWFAILSLPMLAATIALWIRSRGRAAGDEDHVSAFFARLDKRYTLCVNSGRIVLRAPPRLPAGTAPMQNQFGQTAETLAAGLVDTQVKWVLSPPRTTTNDDGNEVTIRDPIPSGPDLCWPSKRLLLGRDYNFRTEDKEFPRSELIPPLLCALEDPQRFLGAHVAASLLEKTGGSDRVDPLIDGTFKTRVDGLHIHLQPNPNFDPSHKFGPGDPLEPQEFIPTLDPADFPRIRQQWHGRFDASLGSISLGWMIAIASVLPTIQLIKIVRKRTEKKAGACTACGYDLRASPDRCPECGKAVPKGTKVEIS